MDSKGKKPPVLRNKEDSEFVRKFKTRPVIFIGTIIVLVIVIVAFVFVPAIVPEAARGQMDLTFGSYNKIPISYVPGNYFGRVQRQISQNMQNSLDQGNFQFLSYQIWRQAFEEAVLHTAMLSDMEEAGYKAPKDLVNRRVAALPDFQENGHFSAARYRQLDNAARMALWKDMQDTITKERYRDDITGLRISSKEADFIASMASPQRSFDLVTFPLEDYPDSEAVAYAQANPSLFRITHLYRITISSGENEAKKVLTEIHNGMAFEDAARSYSQDSYADRGGDLGLRMVFEFNNEGEERRDMLASLAGEEFSSIIKTDAGWVFYRAETAAYAADTGDSANLQKIRTYLMDYERGRVEDWIISEADDFIDLAKANDFESALLLQGLDKQSFGPLPVNYGSRRQVPGYGGYQETDGVDLFRTLSSFSIGELSSAGNSDIFWRNAFQTPLGTPSSPFVIGNTVLVLYPVEESAADENTVDGVKGIYNGYWLSYNTELFLRPWFLSSAKLQDRFMETFLKLYITSGDT